MATFNVPTHETVSEANKAIFDQLEKGLGFVPNLFATFAHSDTALSNYLTFQNGKSSLRAKEREVINLVVSQINECAYCLAAHTALGKMNGFSDEQIVEIRTGRVSWDAKLDALARFAAAVTINRGKPAPEAVEAFLAAGYTKGNLIDAIIIIGDKIISNYVHGVTQVAVDFPAAAELEPALA